MARRSWQLSDRRYGILRQPIDFPNTLAWHVTAGETGDEQERGKSPEGWGGGTYKVGVFSFEHTLA